MDSKGIVIIACDAQGCYRLDGSLIFNTVAQLRKQSDFLHGQGSEVRIDLHSVDGIDSAGIALLLEWIERAKQLQKDIVWYNMPERMTRLIRINGLEQFFQQSPQAT